MALEIDTLSENKSVFNPSEDLSSQKYGIWDLTKSSISFNGVDPRVKTFAIVPDYFQMRPDLIAAINLGNQGKMGSLLKFNNISNPFSLYQGQILAVPEDGTVDDTFRAKKLKEQRSASSNTNTNPNQAFKKNQEQKKFIVSEGRKKFLESKIKNAPSMLLPPNVAQPGDVPVIKKDGFLIFAPNSGGGGFNSPV